ncbi:MAG: 30S ribosome-binding factor RbfA [Candidatus Omnitrophota bacterium]|nr:30S ribosome-binding factor RbfA [Candidatus Omnitrophota bacterium]RKY33870.1 MAG: 30S ribosome-binding factor RbfA [Candidatus Omnitrophota bacterium]RKY38111.1 MAG: 30S ribosome-binding factor RbfA [Candidatus Omnitrophota bacterium]RKY46391.1 MAG: 30S ribosome-binding factor RbfA [Candidatus Omnitrophota bacterium]HDN85970.1 30S ribosome-binding factor RbfA [Candidatus Omnitrophota bacterium]
MSLRLEKVNKEIKKRLMEIIQKEVDDPSLGLVSITRVETTPDLRQTRVYFSVLKDKDFSRIEKILNSMRGFLRKLLGKKLRIKVLPSIKFFPDKSIKYSVEIYKKIEEVMGDKKDY